MTTYLVPAGFGEAEYIEKRSRFIARVWPIESEAEAVAHIEAMRKLMIMGVGIGEVAREVAVLAGMTVVLLVIALKKFNVRLK